MFLMKLMNDGTVKFILEYERLFSALKLQKSDLRNQIKADALDALLFLKANADQIDDLARRYKL